MTLEMIAKAEQAASEWIAPLRSIGSIVDNHDENTGITGFLAGAEWQASEMAQQLAAKDAAILAMATRIAFYQNVIDAKESLIAMLHAEIQQLSDSVDGWKGRATGQE